MRENENMKTILVSEIHKLDTFDFVKLIDDKTHEFRGYFLNPEYHNIVQGLLELEDRDTKIDE